MAEYIEREKAIYEIDNWLDSVGSIICSVCGGKSPKLNFCGRCGAKMNGERKDTE